MRAEKCAVCGQEIMGDTVYIVTDKVTNEKKHLCYDCSILPDTCFVCGMPVKKDFITLLDGRVLCARDAKNAVLDADEAKRICEEVQDELDRLFSRFTAFPTNLDVSVVDRVSLLALFKVPGNDFECPDVLGYFRPRTNHNVLRYQISLMSALSHGELQATCAHELSHAWVSANVPPKRRENIDQRRRRRFFANSSPTSGWILKMMRPRKRRYSHEHLHPRPGLSCLSKPKKPTASMTSSIG